MSLGDVGTCLCFNGRLPRLLMYESSSMRAKGSDKFPNRCTSSVDDGALGKARDSIWVDESQVPLSLHYTVRPMGALC